MKKVLLVALLAIGVSAASYAQGGPGGRTPEAQLEQLKTQVTGITDAQSAKLKVIFEAAGKTRDSLMAAGQNGGGDMSTMMATFTKMNDAQAAKVKAVLTAEQLPAYQKVLDARAEMMKQRMQGN
jgi:hypothetical protein